MKRYFVLKKTSTNNEHINEQDLIPASAKLITGIAVNCTVKKEADTTSSSKSLAFPQNLIKQILKSDSITNLFFSYMRTRATEEECKSYFEIDILPTIIDVLRNGIIYPVLSDSQQTDFSNGLSDLLMGKSDSSITEEYWEQAEADLKTRYKEQFYSFLTSAYIRYNFDPKTILTQTQIDLIYSLSTRNNALAKIAYSVYYSLFGEGYTGAYSMVLRTVTTQGNSIMLGYDSELAKLEDEKAQWEQQKNQGLTDYLFSTVGIFDKGLTMSDTDYAQLITNETLSFLYQNKDNLFKRPVNVYVRPESYECGTLSLLVNGNSFLLRDYILTANRNVKHLSKEIIPFSEPLEVNSSIQTIYKSNLCSGAEFLNIRIYIEFEDYKEVETIEHKVEEAKDEHE